MSRILLLVISLSAALCFAGSSSVPAHSYLYVWLGAADHKSNDFLGVLDADPASPHYGAIVASTPVDATATHPHHTELEMPANRHLLANGFMAGRTWLFDLTQPTAPRVLSEFRGVGGFSFPHTFIRLPNGDVLGSFQYAAGEAMPTAHDMANHEAHPAPRTHSTGGLVELTERGRLVRSGSAADAHATPLRLHPYSVVALSKQNLAISTTTDMDENDTEPSNDIVQFWRLSDLKLLRSIALPAGPRGNENTLTGEPKLLPDGSVYIHTFACGLYRLRNVTSQEPGATLVYSFEGKDCGVPVLAGHYWLQPVPALHALLSLDISDPEHPKEVSRVAVGDDEEPHWLAIDSTGRRLVMNSGGYTKGNRLFVINFDPQTGAVALDEKFRDAGSDKPGVLLNDRQWPHGYAGTALPHGSLFSR